MVDGDQQSRLAFDDDLGNTPDRGRDHGAARRQRFDDRIWKPLAVGAEYAHVEELMQVLRVDQLPREVYTAVNAPIATNSARLGRIATLMFVLA